MTAKENNEMYLCGFPLNDEEKRLYDLLMPNKNVRAGTLETVYETDEFVIKKTNRPYDFVAAIENITDADITITTESGNHVKIDSDDCVGYLWSESELYDLIQIMSGNYEVEIEQNREDIDEER